MKDIKKLMITLVALLAVTTGAWADGPVDGTIAWSVGNEASATVSASIKDAISSTGVTTGSGLTVNTGRYFDTEMARYQPATTNAGNVEGVMIEYTIEAVDGYKFKPTGVDYAAVQDGTSEASYSWSYTIDGVESAITDVSNTSVLRDNGSNSGTAQLMHSESITADGCSVFTLRFYISNCRNTKKIGIANITISGSVSAAAASSGPEVAWDKAEKTGSFTMPGGNVTLEPEYYPQAALAAAPTAINDVPATTDGAIVSAGTVANIGETTTAQGTVMYYVSPSALDDAALQALAADQWTADVPTAADLAQGQAYVYYYVRGNDSDNDDEIFNDGDILATNAIQVTLGAAPTYAVTFADDTAEPTLWTASPATGVTKGETVTVTYTGSKKVIGVKAEKKAAEPASTPLDNTTTAWTAGTFAVPAGGLTYSDAITVSGDVTLTLTDGETLTLNKGISLASGATLTIQGNGAMNVNGTNESTASTVAGSTGTLILTSGTLNAKGGNGQSVSFEDDYHGGSGGTAINGSVTVSGGTLTAIGGNGGNANTGGGFSNSYGGSGGTAITGSVTINSGTLTATGGNGGNLSCGEECSHYKAGNGGDAIGGSVTENGGTTTFANGSDGSASTGPECSDCNAGKGGKGHN